jgi:hypothetical protein
MSSVSSDIIWSNYAYANTSGSIAEVGVIWNSFLLGPYNSSTNIQTITCNFGLVVNSQGGSSGGAQSTNRQVSVWLNDVQVSNQQDAFNINTYQSTGVISKIRVQLYAQGSVFVALGPERTSNATAQFDYTVNLQNVGTDSDFIFLKSQTQNFLILPPVANITKPRFFKIVGTGKKVWLYSYNGECNIYDTSQTGIYFSNDWACLTLVSDGSQWYVANYYPSNNQSTLPKLSGNGNRTSDSNNTNFASPNVLNVFRSDISTRSSGDNYVFLPSVGGNLSPSICVIAYVGSSTSTRGGGNALILCNQYIDGVFASESSGGNYYIATDAGNTKSTGLILITDNETGWYVAGWMYGPGWQWDTTDGGYWGIDGNSLQQTCITAPNTNRFYTLPTAQVTGARFMIIKTTTITSSGVRYSSYEQTSSSNTPPGVGGNTSTPNLINDSIYRLFYTGNQTKSCIWLMSEQRPGESINRYYPLIGYTPS